MGACCFRQPKPGNPISYNEQDYDRHGYNVSNLDGTFKEYGSESHGQEEDSFHGNTDLNLTWLDPQRKRDRKRKKGRRRERRLAGMDCIETDDGFSYTCEHLPLFKCQARLRALQGEREPVSFSPGKECSEAGCDEGCGCLSQGRARRYGETFRQGCEECVCTQGGKVECTCTQATQRKEIRDLTLRDRKRYQRAVRMLCSRPGIPVT